MQLGKYLSSPPARYADAPGTRENAMVDDAFGLAMASQSNDQMIGELKQCLDCRSVIGVAVSSETT